MIQVTPQMRIPVALEPADFRKGIDGLARLCQEALQQDPFSGAVFVFRNRRATAVKVLIYDGQGFWVQPNGAPRDMVCRGLLLALHRAGHIALPPRRCTPPNPLVRRVRPAAVTIDTTPLCRPLEAVRPLTFHLVRRTHRDPLFNSLLEHYHYLGYTQPVGEHLKYLVYAQDRPIACLAWSSAPRHLGARDRFIGWSPAARRKNIRFIAYNLRFLILPWVDVRHLASHLLSCMARRLSADWARVYGHPIWFLETFVDPHRFAGTCYRAANWIFLGLTTGRGKNDQTRKPNRSVKEVWGYPLDRRFRQWVSQET